MSSSPGLGTWTAEGNEYLLVEGNGRNYYFYLEDGALEFIADYSDNFCKVADGEKFILSDE